MSLRTTRIGDLGCVVTGRTPPGSQPDWFGDVYPFITPSDISDDVRHVKTARLLSEVGARAMNRILLPARTICVVCIGATIGKVCMTDRPSASNQQINSIVVDETRYDPHYIFAAARLLQPELRARAAGAATPIINKSSFEDVHLPMQELAIQRQVGRVLCAYDDLIEVNLKRSSILEAIAHRMFDEWFVRYGCAVGSSERFGEDQVGVAPPDWVPMNIGDLIEFDPSTSVSREGEKKFVPMSSLSVSSMVIENWETRSGNAGAKFRNGDTLLARITPCLENGKTGYVDFLGPEESAFGSTEYIVMRGVSVPSAFVYLLARSERFRQVAINSMGGADGRQRVRADALRGLKVYKPTESALAKFDEIIAPIFKQIRTLANQITCLRRARDLLLPGLISGEISLREIVSDTLEAA